MNELETQRQENIKRNKARLDELGILYKAPLRTQIRDVTSKPVTKKRKLDSLPPSRVSARIASAPRRPTYTEEEENGTQRSGRSKASKPVPSANRDKQIKVEAAHEPEVPSKDVATLRVGWTSWKPTGPAPMRDEDAAFHFEDQPTFTPNKSPEEMLREGCFGGSYYRPLYSMRLSTTIENDYLELPSSWIEGLDIEKFITSPEYDPEVNKYKVKCGQSIEEWEAAGWIDHKHDVRGWFQWYCRFFMGRRCEDDDRQISRWRKCAGETGRWRRALLKKYRSMGVREVFDDGEDEDQNDVSPVMHQTCFQWAYEVRQGDLDRYWASGT